jgi:hypothetical protein
MGNSIRQPIELSDQQVEQLRKTTKDGTANFPAGYDLIYGWIKKNEAAKEDGTVFWFEQARGINGDDSLSSRYIRRHTQNGANIDGVPGNENLDMQSLSNKIARNVLRDVLREQEVPALPVILSRDISVVLNDGNIKLGGWGGSIYYWDMPYKPDSHKGAGFPRDSDNTYHTVGEEITRLGQTKLMIESSSRSIAQMVENKEISPKDIGTILETATESGLPWKESGQIFARTVEILGKKGIKIVGDELEDIKDRIDRAWEKVKDKIFSDADNPSEHKLASAERSTNNMPAMLNQPTHPQFGMVNSVLTGLNEEDKKRGREPHPQSEQIAASLVCDARDRGLDKIGFFCLSTDGRHAYMTDTANPSAEWAKTAVGDVGRAAQSSLPESSERIAQINQRLELQNNQTTTIAQAVDTPAVAPKSISM